MLQQKSKYFAIIYSGVLGNETTRKIHKALYDATINNKPQYADKYLLGFAIKTANKAKKIHAESATLLAIALMELFLKQNSKAKHIINYDLMKETEKNKDRIIDDYIENSRKDGKWFYLASSHGDCAEDHKDYQGKLYVDANAPADVIEYAKARALYTVQWVMGDPVWFITRPNCRHYFVSLTEKEVRGKSLKRLKHKYKTHNREGDRDFATPRSEAIAEYEDRLKMLRALYREYPTDKLKKEILKTEMLLKKWKNK